MARPGLTVADRESMAIAMHHSTRMQQMVYDRRTISEKVKRGGKLIAKFFHEAMEESDEEEESEKEELLSE